MNFSRTILLLILAAILPLVVFTAVLGVVSLRQQREATESEAIAKVEQVSALIDRELAAQTRVLQAISASSLLSAEKPDIRAIEVYFRHVLEQQPAWRRLYLSTPGGETIAITPALEPGAPARILETASLNRVNAEGAAVVGDMIRRGSNPPTFPLRAPVIRDGQVAYVVSASVEPWAVGRMLDSAGLPDTWLGAVVDRRGIFVARTRDARNRVGTPGSEKLRAAVKRGGSGIYPGTSLEGASIVTAYKTLPASSWSVHVAVPQSIYIASFNRSLWLVVGGGIIVLIAVALFLWLLIRELDSRNRREAAYQEGQRLEALGRITGGVAHDFNNLLMIVQGGAEAIRRNPERTERAAAYLDAILAATERGKTLTRQLLAFGRRSSHEPVSFRLQDRAEGLRALLEKSTRTDITTSVMIPADVGAIYADPSALEIALINLAVNARDATPGPGHLALTAFNATLDKDARTGLKGDFVALVVSDSGSGIPKDELARIFEPFYTTKAPGKGTGLGLSQVYGFVQQSGGTITVDSEPGEGTSFTLYLPRATVEPAAAREPAALHSEQGEGRILVVEDNPDVSMVTQALLREAGFDVAWAASGQAALELLAAQPAYDAVLSDILMPGMTGLELAARLRGERPKLPIVLMTGYSDALAEGVAQRHVVLQKPFGQAEVMAALHRARSDARADSMSA